LSGYCPNSPMRGRGKQVAAPPGSRLRSVHKRILCPAAHRLQRPVHNGLAARDVTRGRTCCQQVLSIK
jgi:hypothetical protein